MNIRMLLTSTLGLLLCVSAPAQTSLISVVEVQIRPDRTAEFDASIRKMVDANRRNQGSNWVALQVMWGEGIKALFAFVYDSHASIEKGGEAFNAAMAKVFTPAGVPRFFHELDRSVAGIRREVRRRRPDLSANLPEAADMAAAVGRMRYLRTNVVTLRPGYLRDYEEQIKALRDGAGKAGNKQTVYVSQGTLGAKGTVFYIARYHASIAELDEPAPSALQLLGEAGYEKYTSVLRAGVIDTEAQLWRVRPEWSNPMEEMVATDPSFWNPKPAAAPKPKKQ